MMQPAAKMSRSLLGGIVAQESMASSAPAMVDHVEPERDASLREDSTNKLDAVLGSLVAHVEKKTVLQDEVAKQVINGKVFVRIWLSNTRSETLEKLKALGFELVAQPKTGHLVIGKLPIATLVEASDLAGVQYMAFQPGLG